MKRTWEKGQVQNMETSKETEKKSEKDKGKKNGRVVGRKESKQVRRGKEWLVKILGKNKKKRRGIITKNRNENKLQIKDGKQCNGKVGKV